MMKIRSFGWIVAALAIGACDSPLDTDPTAQIDAGTAVTDARGVQLALNGAYAALQDGDIWGAYEMVYADLYADNLDFTGTFQVDREVAIRNISTGNGNVLGIWEATYRGINRANILIAAVPGVGDMSQEDKDRVRGEMLFLRALNYSALARYFGDVPLVLEPSTGVSEASNVSRDPVADVWTRVTTDLEEAATLLAPDKVNGRATRHAANALAARAYLEAGKYTQARDKATAVINSNLYGLPAFRSNWTTKNNTEAIFELQFSKDIPNLAAYYFFPSALGGRFNFTPSAELLNSFEPNDARRLGSIDSTVANSSVTYYANKYHRVAVGDDNIVILRLAEMYLIRAEANARLNADPATVRADLDTLRGRAGLGELPDTVTGQAALFDAILQERRAEMAFEGQRFFDLRRLGRAEAVLGIPATRLLWPIPQAERDVNIKLGQNDGY